MTRWNWIDDFVLPAGVAALTAAWVSLWVRWAARAAQPAIAAPAMSPLLLGAVLLLGVLVTRWALFGRYELPGARWIILGAGLLAVLTSGWLTYRFASFSGLARALLDWGQAISPAFSGMAAAAFMWWVGIRLGRAGAPQQTLEHTFYGGLVGLALALANNQLRPLLQPGEALLATLVFLGAGLASLALMSVENARRYQESVTGTRLELSRYWLSTVAGVIGLVLLVGLAGAALLSPQAFSRAAALFTVVLDVLTAIVILVIGALVYLLAWVIFPLVQSLLRRQPPATPTEAPEPPTFEQATDQIAPLLERFAWLEGLRQALLILALLVIAGLVFWWSARRFSRPDPRTTDEVRESIVTRDLVLDQLRHLFRHPDRPAPAGGPFVPLTGPPDDPRLIVRRAYQAMLEWAQARSLPRRAGQTPASYARELQQAEPDSRAAIALLTDAYQQARYAPEAPSADLAQRAAGAATDLPRQSPAGAAPNRD